MNSPVVQRLAGYGASCSRYGWNWLGVSRLSLERDRF
jgi:hypothetical protein